MKELFYTKTSYHSRYLKSGINEIEMITEKYIRNDGTEFYFEIKSSTFQDYYHISYSGFNKEEWERTNGIHGRFHGYEFGDFKTFADVQKLFKEKYNIKLKKRGKTQYHHYY